MQFRYFNGKASEKIHPEKYAVVQWHTQAGNITTNIKIKVDITLPTLSATNVVMWKNHVNYLAKVRYNMILGKYLLTKLGSNLKFAEHVIKADDGPLKGYTTPMVDLGTYIFKFSNTEKITPEEQFTDDYFKELYKSEHIRTSTKRLRLILDSKYEKSDLHKVMEAQCQHLTMTQRNELLKLLQRFEDLFDGTLGTCKTDPVGFKF